MADEERKEGQEDGSQSQEQGQTQKPKAGPSVEELKAKLGIATKAPKAAGAPAPKRTQESDFQFTLNAPAEAAPVLKEPSEVSALVVEKKGLSKQWILAFSALAVLALIVGLFFGKVMKERAIENFKKKEAAFILEYFRKARSERLAPGEGSTLEVVKAHVDDTLAVFNAFQNATTPEALQAANEQLMQYLERCRAYRDKQPIFSIEAVFPGVIFNQELAAHVVRFIHAVQRLYDQTALLALEADTLHRVTEPEERGEMIETIFVEPIEENGVKRLKGYFIVKGDWENPMRKDGQVEYAVLPYGAEKGFLAPSTSLAKVDVAPIAQNKSARYRAAIQARVRARLQEVKAAADLASFASLEEKLRKVAERQELFTIF